MQSLRRCLQYLILVHLLSNVGESVCDEESSVHESVDTVGEASAISRGQGR